MILDRDLDGAAARGRRSRPLLADPRARAADGGRARALGRPDAAAHVARVCIDAIAARRPT